MKRKIILILAITLVIASGAAAYFAKQPKQSSTSKPTTSTLQSETGDKPTSKSIRDKFAAEAAKEFCTRGVMLDSDTGVYGVTYPVIVTRYVCNFDWKDEKNRNMYVFVDKKDADGFSESWAKPLKEDDFKYFYLGETECRFGMCFRLERDK